jgi:hypothetical protein
MAVNHFGIADQEKDKISMVKQEHLPTQISVKEVANQIQGPSVLKTATSKLNEYCQRNLLVIDYQFSGNFICTISISNRKSGEIILTTSSDQMISKKAAKHDASEKGFDLLMEKLKGT